MIKDLRKSDGYVPAPCSILFDLVLEAISALRWQAAALKVMDALAPFQLAKPALEHEKDVFVEWPLGATVAEAEELTQLANANIVKTIVGLQGRAEPVILKIKGMLDSQKIGTILSSTVTATLATFPPKTHMKGVEKYLDFKFGGNEFTINFAHFLGTFTHVLGDFADVRAPLKNHYPTVAIIDFSNGEVVDPAYSKTAPDHIFVQGTLDSGAVASISFRKTPAAADDVGTHWIITGTDGEIELTVPEAQWQGGLRPAATGKT